MRLIGRQLAFTAAILTAALPHQSQGHGSEERADQQGNWTAIVETLQDVGLGLGAAGLVAAAGYYSMGLGERGSATAANPDGEKAEAAAGRQEAQLRRLASELRRASWCAEECASKVQRSLRRTTSSQYALPRLSPSPALWLFLSPPLPPPPLSRCLCVTYVFPTGAGSRGESLTHVQTFVVGGDSSTATARDHFVLLLQEYTTALAADSCAAAADHTPLLEIDGRAMVGENEPSAAAVALLRRLRTQSCATSLLLVRNAQEMHSTGSQLLEPLLYGEGDRISTRLIVILDVESSHDFAAECARELGHADQVSSAPALAALARTPLSRRLYWQTGVF